ncbi:LysM peptidoglycan-binding domain-containing protein [Bradyrhizobium sp. 180]|uniref:LysM peptidoglycan-binding domain-containing protein n=1 Tax=unclassified Bradyrhizobium TaxID=2631580 RepID=UPI001FF7013F|nr:MULTISPECIES: LysM peptidoglycan-binding domain-containing protein [unclassified Bradyrhizobium]MCK1422244.1 LysM peptidoglycan-binding domain-containing protein [Bradyrhizobium sp. CW12]MCK1492923.1 LysM peptidoglycan-binding domain-containing protein [Bradyrhizobium sp. 180]MCK1531831.1 LysM peptidoglycan-binding domain-containing protein [Bradyrhizobium sp. 182]MCK1616630.1 LysM peptidoglycan-binding domain-containing protein [Bradyrhizobium sp. 159]MCK1644642.1 LysM peptidoglycan-bindin
MITASKAFIAFCLLAVGGTAVVIGPTDLRRLLLTGEAKTEVAAKPEAKVEPRPELKQDPKSEEPKLAASAPAATVSPVPEPKVGALAETQKQVAALADLAPVKPPAAATDAGPRFDVARIDDHGEAAVIAGRATPGAKVELLRDGKPLDSVVADASGQFVMTPPQLPAGSYELTLRAKSTDGTVTQSARSMPVTIAEAAPPPARPVPAARQEAKQEAKQAPNQAEKPDDRPEVVASLPSAAPRLASAPDGPAARPRLTGAPKPKVMARAPAATAVASASPADALNGAPAEAGGSRVISRGDSLWALSRLAYGDGARYAVIFNANRSKIHNPNLIYPGQTVVMPPKAQ